MQDDALKDAASMPLGAWFEPKPCLNRGGVLKVLLWEDGVCLQSVCPRDRAEREIAGEASKGARVEHTTEGYGRSGFQAGEMNMNMYGNLQPISESGEGCVCHDKQGGRLFFFSFDDRLGSVSLTG